LINNNLDLVRNGLEHFNRNGLDHLDGYGDGDSVRNDDFHGH